MIQYNLSGTWKTVKAVQVKVSGAWKNVGQIYVKVSGAWKPVWSYSWNTGSWGNCSVDCGDGTQTRTVTCKRNDGQTVADSLCTKFVGTKPAVSQTCNLGSCKECRYSQDTDVWRYIYSSCFSDYGVWSGGVSIYWDNSMIAGLSESGECSTTYENLTSYESGGYLYTRGDIYTQDEGPPLNVVCYAVCREAV